jgi:hypothetical protein
MGEMFTINSNETVELIIIFKILYKFQPFMTVLIRKRENKMISRREIK